MTGTPLNHNFFRYSVADNGRAIGKISIMLTTLRIMAELNCGLYALHTVNESINSLLENLIGHSLHLLCC